MSEPSTPPTPGEAPTIAIRWLAIASKSRRGDWVPVIEVNGVAFRDTHSKGLGADEALVAAEFLAKEEAKKWAGDYEVTVAPAQAPGWNPSVTRSQ